MKTSRWNPYLVGVLIGLLSWAVFYFVDKPLGISTAISEVSGATTGLVIGADAVAENPYWAKYVPEWNYGTLFLVGTLLGGFLSAILSRNLRLETVPREWEDQFGRQPAKRFVAAIIGGIIILYGARLAGGCTSGHGISGALQLAVSSWTFLVVMFLSGIVTARLMFSSN